MTNKITRRRFMAHTGILVGGVLVGPQVLAKSGSSKGAEKFKIGAVLELSGDDATGGQICKRGYELWAKVINEAGGIQIGDKKYPVDLVVQDCKSDPAQGATACERLITREKVDALFGAYTSGVQIAMNPIAAKYQVPCIAGSAESPGNWKPHPAFTYGIIPSVDQTSGKAIGRILEVSEPKAKTIAVVGANEPFSKDTAEGFRDGAKEAGLDVVYYSLFPKDGDLTPIGNLVAAKKPDIVAVGGHDVLLADMARALKGAGFTPKALIEHYGITDPAFVDELGKDANGVLGISTWLPEAQFKDDVFGTAQEYTDTYEKTYNAAPDYTAGGCSAAGVVLTHALRELGEKPGLSESAKGKLNDIIAKTDMTAFYGPIKFADSGDHFHNNTVLAPLLVQIQEDKIRSVAPKDAAQADIVYPMQPWDER